MRSIETVLPNKVRGLIVVAEQVMSINGGRPCTHWFTYCACGEGSWRRASSVLSKKLTTHSKCPKCASILHRTHGQSKTATYKIWKAMVRRCTVKGSSGYDKYGGKGITVSDAWRNYANFVSDMGERPAGLTIERIDNTKGYCKENCRWASYHEQARNKSNTKMIAGFGKTMLAHEWAKETGIPRTTLQRCLSKGHTLENVVAVLNSGYNYGDMKKEWK